MNQASLEDAAKLTVSAADALDDRMWFANHSDRLFRAGSGEDGTWFIRRRRGADFDMYLLTFVQSIAAPRGDSNGELAVAWYAAVYPSWPSERVQKAAWKALKRGAV